MRRSGPGATGPSPAAAPGAPGSRLVAPEVDQGGGERRRAMDRGSGLLDELHELSLGMVAGWLGEDDLQRLASLVEQAKRGAGDRDLPSTLEGVPPRAAADPAEPKPKSRASRGGTRAASRTEA